MEKDIFGRAKIIIVGISGIWYFVLTMVCCMQPKVIKQDNTDVRDQYEKKWAIVKGSVSDSSTGRGIAGSIVGYPMGVVTDSMGKYMLQFSRSATYTIIVVHPDYDTAQVQATPIIGETIFVDIVLKSRCIKYGHLTGKVIDATTSEPLIDGVVVIYYTEHGASIDHGGGYVIYNIPAGIYVAEALSMGYSPVKDTLVVINPNQTTIRNFKLKRTNPLQRPAFKFSNCIMGGY